MNTSTRVYTILLCRSITSKCAAGATAADIQSVIVTSQTYTVTDATAGHKQRQSVDTNTSHVPTEALLDSTSATANNVHSDAVIRGLM